MNMQPDARQVVRAFPSWPERYDAFKDTGYWRAALLTISEEAAAETIHQDNRLAIVCLEAAEATNAFDRLTAIAEIEEIFDEADAAEGAKGAAYRAEIRNGPDAWARGEVV